MTYVVPDYTAQTQEFTYRLPGWGEDVTLPSYNTIPTRRVARLARAVKADDLSPLVEALSGGRSDVADTLWALPVRALGEIYQAWQAAAGVTPGESKASSTS